MLYSPCRFGVRVSAIAGLLVASLGAKGSVLLNLNVVSMNNSVSGISYTAFPGMTDLGFGNPEEEITHFVQVSSPGDDFRGYLNHPLGYGSSGIHQPSISALESALNGTWKVLDVADSQTTEYTFGLNVGGVLESGIPAATITLPEWDSLANPQAAAFVWTVPEGVDIQFVQLFKLDDQDGFESSVASEFFSDGTTGMWMPGVSLEPGARYEFQLVQQQGPRDYAIEYENPVDSEGNVWPHGWESVSLNIQSHANVRFSADFAEIPEPTAVFGGILTLAWAGWRWRRSGRARVSEGRP